MAMAVHAENTDISGIDNVVYIEPCTAVAGSEFTLSVKMKNTVEAEAFGFDLVLPSGITVALDEYNDPKAELSTERTNLNNTNHFDAGFKLDGTLNIQAYSSKGRAISGNDGEVALITLKIAAEMQPGTYPLQLKEIAISDVNSVTYTEALVESSIEIVNGDEIRTVLDENATTAPSFATNANVLVKRTIKANEWSTICLPFAMTAEQVKAAFGDDVELGDFTGTDSEFDNADNVVGIKANFSNVTAIDANHPYIIKVSAPVSEFTLDGVDIVAEEDDAYIEFDNGKTGSRRVVFSGFYGTYHAGTKLDKFTLFLNDNKFWYSTGSTQMKAFRAYFDFLDKLTEVEEAYSSRIVFSFNNESSGISVIANSKSVNSKYYDLQGRSVAKPGKGLYIKNGKKVIK